MSHGGNHCKISSCGTVETKGIDEVLDVPVAVPTPLLRVPVPVSTALLIAPVPLAVLFWAVPVVVPVQLISEKCRICVVSTSHTSQFLGCPGRSLRTRSSLGLLGRCGSFFGRCGLCCARSRSSGLVGWILRLQGRWDGLLSSRRRPGNTRRLLRSS